MSTLKSNVIEPATGTNLTLAASGDVIDVASDSIQLNTWKDSGGNTILETDGAGTLTTVNSSLDIGGGPTLIQSQTANNSTSISFTSGIDSTYDKYMFVCTDIHADSDNKDFGFQANNVTMTTTFFDTGVNSSGGAGNVGYNTANDQAQGTALQPFIRAMGNAATESGAGILHLFNPASTVYVKNFYGRAHNAQFEGYVQTYYVAGYFNVTGAIDVIEFKMTSGTFDGTIKMYGCR